ncbi:MAG: xanthine dehydrogenase family protein molybdopterin-binding subunit [Betaproteobacteria bacterium]|nr:xanthine dehydrogenase family protein molybdopterin-binding subunit [Betaproteobacteria bacterium]
MADEINRYGSAHETLRSEDDPLLTGQGKYTDDIDLPGQAWVAFVRSPVAHARVLELNTAAAARMPGVIAVFTGADLAADGIGAIPPAVSFTGRGGKPMFEAPIPVLAHGQVRYVGESLAIIVAETAAQAIDAAEAVTPELEELPAVCDVERASAPGAPLVWPEAPDNVSLDWEDGDAAAVAAAFAQAKHIAQVRLLDTRLAPSPIEPRAALGAWDSASGRYTLIACTQGVAIVRKLLAESVFKVPLQTIRVLTHDVGGGFGMKVQTYAEYAALLYAARRVGRPVKWCATRLESFLGDTHARDGVLEGELALDAGGRFLALRVRNRMALGAYVSTFAAIISTNNTKNCLSSVYRIPAIHIGVKAMFTHTVPLGPYRGAGRPEAIYLLERLIDAAARQTGVDRVALRRRNLIPPSAMPYQTPNSPLYDSGEFEAVLDKALALADWNGFAARRDATARAGKLRGIGLCCFLEVAGGAPLQEVADLRFEADGKVVLRTGAQAIGQGHLTTFPPIIARQLGIPVSAVRLVQGDSDEVPVGVPTVASRSMMMAGGATVQACQEAIDKGRRIASHLFETSQADIDFADGRFRVSGTDREIPLLELAARARTDRQLPREFSGGLDTVTTFQSPQMSFPNGCHVCEVEIDPDTGVVAVVGYTAVDDVGSILQQAIVEGQIHGGIAQGLGQVLGEQIVYGEGGQLLTASFMDYMIPRADDLPSLRIGHHVVPCINNPLGVKGAGESGVAGSLPSAICAILDALAPRGITDLDLPATPWHVWSALNAK